MCVCCEECVVQVLTPSPPPNTELSSLRYGALIAKQLALLHEHKPAFADLQPPPATSPEVFRLFDHLWGIVDQAVASNPSFAADIADIPVDLFRKDVRSCFVSPPSRSHVAPDLCSALKRSVCWLCVKKTPSSVHDDAPWYGQMEEVKARWMSKLRAKALQEEMQAQRGDSVQSAPQRASRLGPWVTVEQRNLVLSHNDLLAGNILVEEEEQEEGEEGRAVQKLTFLDFEYAGWNPAVYDLANHWHEFCGFNENMTWFPDRDVRTAYLDAYLSARFEARPHDPLTRPTPEMLRSWLLEVSDFLMVRRLSPVRFSSSFPDCADAWIPI